ncbi:MAG: glycerol-3-phosphate dehydrogenase, partial [Burkholderiaceae bacterium]|nr:glycerol-3-phosphate dehydrogenase [Burkholderiaceae bacterium]
DYRFELDQDGPPMLTVFGGKITTFRKLAEEALDLLAPLLCNSHGAWTEHACLPGGDLYGPKPQNRSVREFERYILGLQQRYAWLPADLVRRYAHAYGNRIHVLLDGCSAMADMGEEVAPGLHGAELEYLVVHEWARDAADILWRRSKLGLHLPADSAQRVTQWLARHPLRPAME